MWMVPEITAHRHATASTSPSATQREPEQAADHELDTQEGQAVGAHLYRQVPSRVQHGCRQGEDGRFDHGRRLRLGGPARSGPQDVNDERQGVGRLGADLDPAVEGLQGVIQAARIVEVQLQDRLTLLDRVALLGQTDHPGRRRHRVLLAGPPGAEPPGDEPHGHGVEPGDEAASRRPHLVRARAHGQRLIGIAALRGHHRVPHG